MTGGFSTALFERYQRSEKALLSALVEMYVQGVSTRKVKKITEELCGYRFSASTISNIVKRLDAQLLAFARRRLGRTVSLCDRRCAIREGARQRGDRFPGGADRARHRRRKGGARCWRWSWPTGKAHRRGRGFFSASRSAACRASSSSSPTITRVSRRRSPKSFPRRPGSVATCTSSQKCPGPHAEKTRRRLPAGTALALRPPRYRRGAARSGGLADALAGQITPRSPTGSRTTSRRLWRSTGCRANTTNTSSRPTCWSATIRRSSGAPTSCASFPTARAACALAVETHEDWLEANRYINMKLLTEHKRELMKQAA